MTSQSDEMAHLSALMFITKNRGGSVIVVSVFECKALCFSSKVEAGRNLRKSR